MKKIIFTLLISLSINLAFGTTYYVSNSGIDENDGLTTETSWQTLEKVNNFEFQPGDSVLFECGSVWRGQLVPQSGEIDNHIYYGSYGDGTKPLLLGSIEQNLVSDWTEIEPNIWSTETPGIIGSEQIANSSFDSDASGWNFYTEGAASASGSWTDEDYMSASGSYKIECVSSGDNVYEIQFSYLNLNVESGKTYSLSFNAKSSESFVPAGVLLMQPVPPYQSYSSNNVSMSQISTEWESYSVYFIANTDASDAMLDIFFGANMPDNSVLFLDDISFKEAEITSGLTMDVGNIIFDEEADFGVKKNSQADLLEQGDFYFDNDTYSLKIYSESNPAEYYSDIECALTQNIINEQDVSYAIYDGLELKYGGGHGIGGGNTNNIVIRNCEISFIGGGVIYIEPHGYVRYGNGIEFWENASNNLVENCTVYEVYDAAITNQNAGQIATQTNIVYRNNLIYNSEWSFEYWNRPAESVTSDIYFINNTCLFAGNSWAHEQRHDKRGHHLNFFECQANTENFIIQNNIFYEATSAGMYYLLYSNLDDMELNYNCWYQTWTDTVADIRWGESLHGYYTMSNFNEFYTDYNQSLHSFCEDPDLTSTIGLNVNLQNSSPCIDAGNPNILPYGDLDYFGIERLLDGNGDEEIVVDIGCAEYQNPLYVKQEIESMDFIYPNPSDGIIYIDSDMIHTDMNIEIFTSSGQLVFQLFKAELGEINIKALPPGLYYLKAIEANKIRVQKLILQ